VELRPKMVMMIIIMSIIVLGNMMYMGYYLGGHQWEEGRRGKERILRGEEDGNMLCRHMKCNENHQTV
jgi:hypothetical protein